MTPISEPAVGRFCWLDLAASDAAEAKAFYRRLFGWTTVELHANGGIFTRLCSLDRDVGSLSQMEAQCARKVPSHWTPSLRVEPVERAAGDVDVRLGAVVRAFEAQLRADIEGLVEVSRQPGQLGLDVVPQGGRDFELLAVGIDAHRGPPLRHFGGTGYAGPA